MRILLPNLLIQEREPLRFPFFFQYDFQKKFENGTMLQKSFLESAWRMPGALSDSGQGQVQENARFTHPTPGTPLRKNN